MRASTVLIAVCVLSGCGDVAGSIQPAGDDAQAQSMLDRADRSCTVALRTLTRASSNGTFVTNCVSGRCFFVWEGTLDVVASTVAAGGQAFAIFRNRNASQWSQVTANQVTPNPAPAGFVRYSFRLDRDTMETGLSSTSISRSRIEVAPFWQTASGDRLFDKQRGQGDSENYALTADNQFTVSDDAKVCPGKPFVASTLVFQTGWRNEQHAALVAGGTVTLDYAIERLPDCRGTHNGYPAWDIRGSVRFFPSLQVVEGTVRGFDGSTPNNSTAHSVPLTVAIPVGATRAEVWFSNFTGAGSSCQAWDSNEGANYSFDIEPVAFKPVGWLGDIGSSFARDCTRRDGVADPAVLDSYVQQRACAFVEIDVWVPGLTDASVEKPAAVLARAQQSLDGVALTPVWLSASGRTGNNYRYRFTIPKSDLYYGPKWSTFTYTLQTSTDGTSWASEPPHSIRRDVTFCNPAWSSCDL